MTGFLPAGAGDLPDREVTVDGERKRPRDRCRRHVKTMGGPVLGERGTLLDPEPVLLVDDRHGQRAKVDAFLDQCVRPDGDSRGSARDRLARGCMLARGESARQQHDLHADPLTDPFDRHEVLLGERLGRSHQRPLVAALDSAQRARRERPPSSPSRRPPGAACPSARFPARSRSISAIARSWAAVSVKGRAER